MIKLSNKCCGCTACASICPNGAISMHEDAEGFLSPTIDKNLCIECNKCIYICPMENPHFYTAAKSCFACTNTDEEARFKSSSGAVFPLLADFILNKNGYVCGAAVDKDLTTRHIIVNAENREELNKLFGSKYVQSDLGDIFIRIKKWLQANKHVLFSGTPCQVAGLNAFLGKEFDTLFTVDIVCHGVPSPGILKLYLEEIGKNLPDIASLSFRDKAYGWKSVKLVLKDINENILLSERIGENPYLKAFQQTAILRNCCHSCPFTRIERTSDITIADFWKIKELSKNFSDNLGTSLVICNTPKGESIFEFIQSKLSKKESFPINEAKKRQINLRRPSSAHPLRERVFELYRHKIEDTNSIYSKKSFVQELSRLFIPVGIINFFDADNFGAVLVPYALSKLVEKCGYHAEIINLRKSKNRENNSPKFEEFREKFLLLSPEGYDIRFLKSVLHRYKNIITGSDQVFRMRNTGTYMLNWVDGYKNILSYAASFGTTQYTGSLPPEKAAHLLKRFDFISVREKEGVDICKNFGLQSIQVLDPVIMLDAQDYQVIIDSEPTEIPKKEYVGCIFLGESRKILLNDKAIAHDVKSKYPLINIVRGNKGILRSIPEYLSLIKNSKYILTNSFHGLVLSIIFKKSFISVVNLDPSRQQSLLNALGISSERLVNSINDINLNILEHTLDYESIYIRLFELRKDSFEFLNNSLNSEYSLKKCLPLHKNISIEINNKEINIKLIYEDNFKKYYEKDLGIIYSISLYTGICFINGTTQLNRYDSNICNNIFTAIEKSNIKLLKTYLYKINDNILHSSSFFQNLKRLFIM